MIPAFPYPIYPRQSTVICSMATGDRHLEMLQVMTPTVSWYAAIHDMDSYVLPLPGVRLEPSRPPAWDKIILIRRLLDLYQTVIWIDADAIICNPWRDIRHELSPACSIFVTAHRLWGTLVPNTGVWVLRRGKATIELLEAVWAHTRFIDYFFWEQDAFMDLIGFDAAQNPAYPYRGETKFSPLVGYLSNEWNSVGGDAAVDPVIVHFAGFKLEQRAGRMRECQTTFLRRLAAPTETERRGSG